MAIAITAFRASIRVMDGSPFASLSSSTGQRTKAASASTGRSRPAATSATPRGPMRRIVRKASVTNHRNRSAIMAQPNLQAVTREGNGDAAPSSVDLRRECEAVEIAPILAQLDQELIGLVPVKTRIREIASLLLVERIRRKMSLANTYPTLHMSFTGNPGTGKTTVALRIADILHRLGFVRRGHVI